MSRTLKIILLIFGLSIFILPKQTLSAQSTEQCSDKKDMQENCCSKDKKTCHSDSSKKKSEKSNCDDDCTSCHFCSVHVIQNFIPAEAVITAVNSTFAVRLQSGYRLPYTFSSIPNIWQPPKIG
ncbi:hypothetical protein [Kaistella palustris]|uniref:hypothetical protein n=1 Tax=Kaistella palustris TaxID=493376 RepID=UPI00048770D8|nr:hypothetical protein [Kaistella palustris]